MKKIFCIMAIAGMFLTACSNEDFEDSMDASGKMKSTSETTNNVNDSVPPARDPGQTDPVNPEEPKVPGDTIILPPLPGGDVIPGIPADSTTTR